MLPPSYTPTLEPEYGSLGVRHPQERSGQGSSRSPLHSQFRAPSLNVREHIEKNNVERKASLEWVYF